MRLCPMKTVVLSLIALLVVPAGASGQETIARTKAQFQWLAFPDSAKFKVLGLHWFDGNEAKLWRMPAKEMDLLPKGVQGRSKCPSGGRIVLRCTTTQLAIRAEALSGGGVKAFDVYVDG